MLKILDFYSTTCIPCKKVAPIIDDLEEEYSLDVQRINIELDESQSLIKQYKVKSIPTVIFLKDDEVVETYSGPHPKSTYEILIKKYND